MNEIKWIKSGSEKYPLYEAKVGCMELQCRVVEITPATKDKKAVEEWVGNIYFGNEWIVSTKTIKKLKFAQQDAERIAVRYLFGCGSVVLKGLKRIGLLEEILFEVGIEI